MSVPLTDLLALEKLDENLFRSRYHRENFRSTLFGGQVLGQALMAAAETVPERLPHSLHAYFLHPGNSQSPVIYDVESVRDGRSFSTRRVVARQQGRVIFNMSASFHTRETGYEHAEPVPGETPTPDELQKTREKLRLDADEAGPDAAQMPFYLLPVEDHIFADPTPHPPRARFWLKSVSALPDQPIYHYCSLAFASDLGLLATSLLPHDTHLFEGKVMPASIDHAMWFHTADLRADDWVLYVTDSPWAGGGRGFNRGLLYDQTGRLIASTAQEGLIRPL